jgi:hypothetical protein
MRLRQHMLATPQRVAICRSVGTATPHPAQPARGGRQDRLGADVVRLGERGGQKGGQKTGKNPTDKGKNQAQSIISWWTAKVYRWRLCSLEQIPAA